MREGKSRGSRTSLGQLSTKTWIQTQCTWESAGALEGALPLCRISRKLIPLAVTHLFSANTQGSPNLTLLLHPVPEPPARGVWVVKGAAKHMLVSFPCLLEGWALVPDDALQSPWIAGGM